MRLRSLKPVLFLCFVWVFCFPALSDHHILFRIVTPEHEIMGQKIPKTVIDTQIWFSDTKAVTENPIQKNIVDLNKNVSYVVFPGEEAYVEMPMPIDPIQYFPEQIRPMVAQMKTTVTVEKAEGQKDILGYPCDTYLATLESPVSRLEIRYFTSTKVPLDVGLYKKRFEKILNQLKLQGVDESGLKELEKIEGFQMGFEMTIDIMGAKVKSMGEVLSIEDTDAPKGLYQVPGDFEKLETLPMPQSRGGQ